MITIVAKSIVKEGCIEKFKELASEHVRESRKEQGCISFNLHQDINNIHEFAFIEEWESKEDIELHNSSDRIKAFGPRISEVRVEKPQINLYEGITIK